ncbi:hypothetical protein Dimus_011454 [Dionaea muscipula]
MVPWSRRFHGREGLLASGGRMEVDTHEDGSAWRWPRACMACLATAGCSCAHVRLRLGGVTRARRLFGMASRSDEAATEKGGLRGVRACEGLTSEKGCWREGLLPTEGAWPRRLPARGGCLAASYQLAAMVPWSRRFHGCEGLLASGGRMEVDTHEDGSA